MTKKEDKDAITPDEVFTNLARLLGGEKRQKTVVAQKLNVSPQVYKQWENRGKIAVSPVNHVLLIEEIANAELSPDDAVLLQKSRIRPDIYPEEQVQ